MTTETLAQEAARAEQAKGYRIISDAPTAAWGCGGAILPLLLLLILITGLLL